MLWFTHMSILSLQDYINNGKLLLVPEVVHSIGMAVIGKERLNIGASKFIKKYEVWLLVTSLYVNVTFPVMFPRLWVCF